MTRGRARGSARRGGTLALGLLVVAATAAPGCTSDTTGTLCSVPIEETILEALIADIDGRTLVELAFKRAPMEGERVEDLSALYLCDGDAVTINQANARPIERAQGQPVYSITQDNASRQYEVVLESDREFFRFFITVGTQSLTLLSPDPARDWGVGYSRAEPLDIAWAPAATEDAPVSIDIVDEIDGVPCLANFAVEFVASGDTLTVPADTITLKPGVDAGESCPASIRVTRGAVAQIDPASGNSAALHSSSALAFVIRQVLIESLP